MTDADDDHHMILGLRDRIVDTGAQLLHFTSTARDENLTFGPGDTLYGTYDPTSDSWVFDTSREHYQDDTALIGDESGQGGLAYIGYLNGLVVGSIGLQARPRDENLLEGFIWYDAASGRQKAHEETCAAEVAQRPFRRPAGPAVHPAPADRIGGPPATVSTPAPTSTPRPTLTPEPYDRRGPSSVGDVELLCDPLAPTPATIVTPTPTWLPSATPRPPTPTRPAATPRSPTPTRPPTVTPRPLTPTDTRVPVPDGTPTPPEVGEGRIHLPLVVRNALPAR